MRFALMMLAVAIVSGCGRVSTVREAPDPDAVRHVNRGAHVHAAGGQALVAPVYRQPRRIVYIACVRAAAGYFGHIDRRDPQVGLYVIDKNSWFGTTGVDIVLADAEDGATRVDVAAEYLRTSSPALGRPHMVIENFLARLAVEMETVAALQEAGPDVEP